MPAMHDTVYHQMAERIAHKRDIFLRTLPFNMTHQECMALVAPKDHIEILTRAAEFADVRSSEDFMELTAPAIVDGVTEPTVHLQMRTHAERTPPLKPRHPQWQAGQSGQKVIDWLAKRLEIGRRFGAARHVLYTLNRECDSGTQLRYMFPQVLSLCTVGKSDKMDRWLEKFAAYKPCRHVPAVSLAMRAAIRDAGALLTSSTLIGEGVPEEPPGFVAINVFDFQIPSFELDGETVRRL